MKNMLRFIVICFSIILSLSFSVLTLHSQNTITEGKEFWFGLPHCVHSSDEELRWGNSPITMYVSSRVDTKITVEDAAGVMGKKVFNILANQFSIIPLNTELENTESEVSKPYGIHVTADDPISIIVFYCYQNTTEAFKVIPAEFLGKEYYTLNMYQDKMNFHDGSTKITNGQILITATKDNTNFIYYPKCITQKGIQPNKSANVKLMKGETYLIESTNLPGMEHTIFTDLSGTYIKADKPIAVLSGHNKGAYPAFPVTYLGLFSDDFRTMLIESMIPIDYLGKNYISIPEKYSDRSYDNLCLTDVEGCLVRIVAIHDSTLIFEMRKDGNGLKQISPIMNVGDYFDIEGGNLLSTVYLEATNKILVGQYAKGYLTYPQPVFKNNRNSSNDKVLGNWDQGQGSLTILTPIEQWGDNGIFYSPPNLTNYINITFLTNDANNLFLDGYSFRNLFSSSIIQIAGTPYSYVQYNISSGTHIITSLNSAKFAANACGNIDEEMSASSYAYPVTMNFAKNCNDTIYLEDTMSNANVSGTFFAANIIGTDTCAALYSVDYVHNNINNYTFSLDSTFKIGNSSAYFSFKINDITKPANATINAMTMSGKTISKSYQYTPELVSANPTLLDFGLLQADKDSCLTFNLINSGTVAATIKDLQLLSNALEFEINKSGILPVTLQPGDSIKIEVCCTLSASSPASVWDSIIVVLSDYSQTMVRLQAKRGEPVLWFSDYQWVNIPKGVKTKGQFRVENRGTIDAVITGINWADQVHFTNPSIVSDFPLTLKPNDSKTYDVYYTPDEQSINHCDTTTAYFTANCDTQKLYSVWIGCGTDSISDVKNCNYNNLTATLQIKPNPSNDIVNISYYIDNNGFVKLTIYNELGEKLKVLRNDFEITGTYNINLDLKEMDIYPGIYFCVMEIGNEIITKPLIYMK